MQLADADARFSLRIEQLIEQQAARTPEAIAVTFEGRSVSYSELCLQAEDIAAQLKKLGAGRGVLIAICVDRCLEMVAAMLAVLETGAAYLPIDPALPSDRIEFMLRDASPLIVISQSRLRASLKLSESHLLLLDAADLLSLDPVRTTANTHEVEACLEHGLDDLAYVLYTSGSTGKPKGVQITHRALTNLLVGVSAEVELSESDVFLATSTISFDVSVFEILAPLISGARLVIAPRPVAVNGELLAEAICANGATFLQATPSGWRVLLEAGWEGQAGLKMLSAGEPLDLRLSKMLLQKGARLWNLYGPTEATIYATGKEINIDQTTITIGKALPNYTAYVLDEACKPLAVKQVGELHLGGAGIAIGYLNRRELTAEKFINDTFTSESGKKLYRTGDVARLLPNGEIELLGRTDNQIKLRGQRIEPEEIEAVLDSHPSVRQSIVRQASVDEFDQRLIAYVVPQTPEEFSEDDLHRHLAGRLPAFMVPAAFIQMKLFELTPSGKVNRKALPVPPEWQSAGGVSTSNQEQTTLDIWRMLLKNPDLDADTNFFYAGGHSLLAIRACSRSSECLGFKVPVSWLIEAPTARSFAERLRSNQTGASRNLVHMQKQGRLPPIYLVHHLLGDILVYRSLAASFAPDRPVYGIQAPDDFTSRSRPFPLSALASEYVSEILQQQKEGPYHLAGYSSGAVLVFEMARQLTESGRDVGLLAFIDGDIRTGPQAAFKPVDYWKMFARKMCKVVFKFADETRDGIRLFVERRIGYVRFLLRIKNLEKAGTADTGITLEQALRLTENAYQPAPYRGSALLIRFRDEASRFGPNPFMGWEGLIQGGIETVDVPGGHITGMNPERATVIAQHLKSRMERFEAAQLVAINSKGVESADLTPAAIYRTYD